LRQKCSRLTAQAQEKSLPLKSQMLKMWEVVRPPRNYQKNEEMNIETDTAAFAKKLTDREFGEFFIYPMHDQTIDRIWEDPGNRQLLDKVLDDDAISNEAKFLACEVFFIKDILFMQRHSPEKMAEVYAQALRDDLTGMANSWGLLYEHEDEGPVGIVFLTIGDKALPALSKLLDDERTHLKYEGSIEATVGNGYRYRVKDFAAYYIGRILGNPLKYYPDLVDRDEQITRLKKELGL
jgi:hypothetical protein